MVRIFDPSYYWIPFALLAFGFGGINLVRSLLDKKKGWQVLSFLSLSFGALTQLMEYMMVYVWVQKADWSALLDVVPAMTFINTVAVGIGIVVNGIVVFRNRQ